MQAHKVTLIEGDGVGPEVINATRQIINASGARIDWEICEAGASVVKKGINTGLPQETIDSIRRTHAVLKGPLETPVGYGAKSANVTLRKLFETYGNIRPIRALPGIPNLYGNRPIDFIIVRENVEDLYAGMEYMETPSVAVALKLISWKGCEKICRLAFEIARAENRKKVHCATKANILKLTEGLLKKVFEEVAKEYPEIEAQHIIVDNCAHQLVKKPEQFEVIVMTNMNGDILGDLSSALIGGLGFAPSANIGKDIGIFEAVHGSAPKYAGKNVINPTAALLSGIMMLRYLKEFEAAHKIENALFLTLAHNKILTRDIAGNGQGVPTSAFTEAIIRNLEEKISQEWKLSSRKPLIVPNETPLLKTIPEKQKTVGIDIFLRTQDNILDIVKQIETLLAEKSLPFLLKLISCRGSQIYPNLNETCDLIDQICCRFLYTKEDSPLIDQNISSLLSLLGKHYPWVQVVRLNDLESGRGYSKAQGED